MAVDGYREPRRPRTNKSRFAAGITPELTAPVSPAFPALGKASAVGVRVAVNPVRPESSAIASITRATAASDPSLHRALTCVRDVGGVPVDRAGYRSVDATAAFPRCRRHVLDLLQYLPAIPISQRDDLRLARRHKGVSGGTMETAVSSTRRIAAFELRRAALRRRRGRAWPCRCRDPERRFHRRTRGRRMPS